MHRLIAFILAVSLLSGCSSFVGQRYGVSTHNVMTLRQYRDNPAAKFKVNEFTAAKDVKEKITCRAAGAVQASPGVTFQKYIRDALTDELILADLYSTKADITIDGVLEHIDFSEALRSEPRWEMKLTLSSNRFDAFTIDHKFAFSGAIDAATACTNVVNALLPAVQDLIRKIIEHPEFQKMLKSSEPVGGADGVNRGAPGNGEWWGQPCISCIID